MNLSSIVKKFSSSSYAGLDEPNNMTDYESIRGILKQISNFEEGTDWAFGEYNDILSASKSEISFNIPKYWKSIKVKFNKFPNARIKMIGSELKSLKNFPTEVMSLVINNSKLESLEHFPASVHGSALIYKNDKLTSLKGIAELIKDNLTLDSLKDLGTLKGCEHLKLDILKIVNCKQLVSLEGMPKFIDIGLKLIDLNERLIVKFPRYVNMGQNGYLDIDDYLVRRLSPTLVLVPGLNEIHFVHGDADKNHIASLFNKHLAMPKTRLTLLTLQQELIDAGFDEQAAL